MARNNPRHARLHRAAALWISVGAALASLTACTSVAESPGASPSATESGQAQPVESTCVADPAAVNASEQDPASLSAALPTDLTDALEAAAVAAFAEAAAPGFIAGVRTAEGTWTTAGGLADPVAGTPMDVGMHTRIGSVTKTFTGTVLMQLASEGLLSLDDPIDEYFPDAGIPNGDAVTLRMLANMTSGVASYTRSTEFTDVYFSAPETIFTPDELVAIGVSESPLFDPGAKFDYSNTNTVLLGLVIEQVTGESIGTVFAERIFEPLGLTGTVWPGESTALPEPFAQGFSLQGDRATPENPSNATHWNPAWGFTAGELVSNMDDLLAYGYALGTGQGLLDAQSQVERLTSFPGEAGYGIGLGCIGGWVGHTGELPGYNTSVFYDTTTDTTVVVQVNSDIASGDCDESPTLTDDPRDLPCSSPATRIFVALSTALGHTFEALPQH